MKTYTARMVVLAAAAVVTMVGSAFAVQTQAEREMSKGNLSGAAGHEARVQAPGPNDLKYRAAMETGNLPSDAGALHAGSGVAADLPTVESGGIAYRVGIDTK